MKKTINFILFISILYLGLTSCSNNSVDEKSVSTDSSSTKKDAEVAENKSVNVFDNTKELTTALSKNGIGELEEWGNPMEMGWGSLSHYFPFGEKKDGIGMENNISYYIEGDESTAKSLLINLNINNAADKKNAMKFLNKITKKTFKSLDLELPNGLSKAILSSKPFKSDIENFTISFELDKSNIETWKVNIVRK